MGFYSPGINGITITTVDPSRWTLVEFIVKFFAASHAMLVRTEERFWFRPTLFTYNAFDIVWKFVFGVYLLTTVQVHLQSLHRVYDGVVLVRM